MPNFTQTLALIPKVKKVYLFFLAVSLFVGTITTSCKKQDINVYDPNFIGTWNTEPFVVPNGNTRVHTLIISETSSFIGYNCDTNCTGCNCSQTWTNLSIKKNGKKITTGKYFDDGYFVFKVNQVPFLNQDNIWTCQIDNDLYYKE
ncbi:MAG: hypothetical protein H6582_01005 [Crocinitomicaceae bacterium]|nr:hypothetical protein [Crocinitomicaceae bacterium]